MLNVIELFAGTGGWVKALNNLGIDNHTYAVEKDKDTINIYNLLHNKNYSCREIQNFKPKESLNEWDVIFMSPPCQNYSKAKQCSKRETDNLISYTVPIIKKLMPRYVIGENVVNYTNYPDFNNWKNEIIKLGYKITCQILNPLDHNWPQNRPRFYWIAFKNEKDFNNYQWPKKESFTYTLDNVIKKGLFSIENYKIKPLPSNAKLRQNDNGYIWGKYIDNRCYLPNRYIGTITTTFNQPWLLCGNDDMIRKLTWRECFLLMGYPQEDINKIKQLNLSDSKYKKMAGNGLVIPLIEKIIKPLNLGNDYD